MTIIQNFGFPVACVVVCAAFINKLWEQQTADKERMYEELEKSREATSKAIDTIKTYADKLEIIQTDVEEIKSKVKML